MKFPPPLHPVFIGLIGLLYCFCGCDQITSREPESLLIAEVGNQRLFLEDIEGLILPGTSPSDSLLILKEYVNTWVRDAAMIDQASTAYADDPQIERLVTDYRRSLILARFEHDLVTNNVDTTVTAAELEALYQAAGDNMKLNQTLVRAKVIKLPSPIPDQEAFEKAWNNGEDEASIDFMKAYTEEYSVLYVESEDAWISAEELSAFLPKNQLGSTRPGSRVARDNDYVYYLRIFEEKPSGSFAPMAYVRDRLHKLLLEQRNAKYLSEAKASSYAALRSQDAVKIYLQNED